MGKYNIPDVGESYGRKSWKTENFKKSWHFWKMTVESDILTTLRASIIAKLSEAVVDQFNTISIGEFEQFLTEFLDKEFGTAKTIVISLKGKLNILGPSNENLPADHVYIGRTLTMGGWKMKQSKWANPFKLSEDSLDSVLQKYRKYVLGNQELMGSLSELKGKVLCCWCSPNKCHGDVLADLLKESTAPKSPVYYGTILCECKLKTGASCTNLAYFSVYGSENQLLYVCGKHSMSKERVKLLKDPNTKYIKAAKLKEHLDCVNAIAVENKKNGIVGSLMCEQMKMMKEVQCTAGYMNIFPNNKHQERKDGYGCSSLSPMQLGPVEHRQDGLPPSLNIENYHQFNKVWPEEVGANKLPLKSFYASQKKGYKDPIPHRHKPGITKKSAPKSVNKNIPLYSVHKTLDGKEKHFTYLESRYFYCMAYESLAKNTKDFKILQQLLLDGYNLKICGYDGYESQDDIYDQYLDTSRPFGHEKVLYSLLKLHDRKEYPWNKYRENNKLVYENIAHVLID